MKVPVRPRQFGLSFNITPLIDIVFLLVIFFLIASHVARSESQEPVALPTATQKQDDVESLPDRLVVTITALPVFIFGGLVDWGPALALAVGFACGGAIGARLTVSGGSRVVRPVMAVAVLAMSGRLLGLY